MLKKCLIIFGLLSFLYPTLRCLQKNVAPQTASSAINSKDQKLTLLKNIAEQINRLAPLDEYTLTVPSFFIVTDKDISQLLATIPYQSDTQPSAQQKKRFRASKDMSMLDALEQTWKSVQASLKRGKPTQKTYQLLETMRGIIDIAFSSEKITLNSPLFSSFVQKAKTDNTALIVRMATDHPTLGPKSVFPVDVHSIYRAIGDTLKTYYQDVTIDQLIQQNTLPKTFYGTVILQQFITQDDLTDPLVSGFSCSQDRVSGSSAISVIEAVYGHHTGFKHEMVRQDTYYIYNDTVVPIIRKKENRLEPNTEGIYTSLIKNNDALAQMSTLDAHAAQEIAKATLLLAQSSDQSVCLSFIKRHNTIYLIDFHYVPTINATSTTYIDPLYIKKAIKDGAIHVISLKPLHHVIAAKNPQQILFAFDVPDLLQQYDKTAERDQITIAVLKQKPSLWSKEQKIIESLPFVTIWSSSPENIKNWVNQRAFPLVIDAQTQLMFPYKRRKNFCTLFQTITPGLNGYPLPEHISIMSNFFVPLSEKQKEVLRPNEFFSGVTMGYLFGLLKNEQPEVALQALRTIVYRLQTRLKRASLILTQKNSEPLDQDMLTNLQTLEKQYQCILTIGYKLYTMMHHTLKTGKKQSDHDQELLFLVDVFQKMITQAPNDTTISALSFSTLLEHMQ